MNPMKLLSRAQFHGAIRLADPQHRLYWIIALFVMLLCALGNLSETIVRFLDAPSYLNKLDTVSTEVLFPAVLVFPEIAFPEEKIENFLATAKYPEGMDAKSIRPIINQLAAFFSPDVPYTFLELSDVEQFLNFNGLDVEEAGLLLMATCEETLIRCRFQWVDLKCDQVFQMELTMYGFCCAFNAHSLKRELRSNVRQNSKYRGILTSDMGPQFGLTVVVNQSQRINDIDLTYKWVVVQSRKRYVDIAKNGTPLSPGMEHWTSFWTRHFYTSEDLSYISDSLLGCRSNKNKLEYFPVYNKRNCLLECQMRLTLQKCQCLMPFLYRPFGIPICQAINLPCARDTLIELFNKRKCDCPFTCEYEYEFTEHSNYKMTTDAKPYDAFYDGLNLSQVTVLRVFVKSHESTSSLRRSIFSFHDLFSQVGGVFNVFFGCSVLTFLELLQLAWHIIRNRSKFDPVKTLDFATEESISKKKKTFLGLRRRVKKTKMGGVKKPIAAKKKVKFMELDVKNSLKSLIR